ncbi:MAG: bifunctional PIG-L family deacetylase/class I SAM-dependent methyltransferase [Mycobacterium sp.]
MAEARSFSHRDVGTSEPAWLLDAAWDQVPRLDLDAVLACCSRVVVVAPHPDDETLALGATLADLRARGVDATVVFVTHGGAADPRRAEGDRALAALGPGISAVWWDLPDGALDRMADQLCRRLTPLVDEHTLLFVPVETDGHADHDAVARAAESVARRQSAILLNYPIWLWHWARPDDMEWARVRVLTPSLRGLRAKSSAIDCYTTQLVAADGFPIVGSAVLNRAYRVVETVLIPAAPDLAARVGAFIDSGRPRDTIAQPFDAMFDSGGDDPWHLDDFAYERRRFAVVLACLGRDRYADILEVGCATGQLTEMLAARADEVVAMDASPRALAVARTRSDRVRWILGAAPADLPSTPFDVVILSEIGYFLDGEELLGTLRAARRLVREHGEIVLAHWRGPVTDTPLDGAAVHAQAAALFDLPLRARYEDADLLVEVWGRPVSVYDEYRDGP